MFWPSQTKAAVPSLPYSLVDHVTKLWPMRSESVWAIVSGNVSFGAVDCAKPSHPSLQSASWKVAMAAVLDHEGSVYG